jgi:hypothetical protein
MDRANWEQAMREVAAKTENILWSDFQLDEAIEQCATALAAATFSR